jgi:hypothetical protein
MGLSSLVALIAIGASLFKPPMSDSLILRSGTATFSGFFVTFILAIVSAWVRRRFRAREELAKEKIPPWVGFSCALLMVGAILHFLYLQMATPGIALRLAATGWEAGNRGKFQPVSSITALNIVWLTVRGWAVMMLAAAFYEFAASLRLTIPVHRQPE